MIQRTSRCQSAINKAHVIKSVCGHMFTYYTAQKHKRLRGHAVFWPKILDHDGSLVKLHEGKLADGSSICQVPPVSSHLSQTCGPRPGVPPSHAPPCRYPLSGAR